MNPEPSITDPASAVAAAKCALARLFAEGRAGGGVLRVSPRVFHPRECEWCGYPREELLRWVERFNAWAQDVGDAEEDPRTFGEWVAPEAVRFRRLRLSEQRRAVYVAQYGSLPPGAEA